MPSLETPDGYQPVPNLIYDYDVGLRGDVFILLADEGEEVTYLEFPIAEDASHLRYEDGEYYFDTVYNPKIDADDGHPEFVSQQVWTREAVLGALDSCNAGIWFTPTAVREAYQNYVENQTVWTERSRIRLTIDNEGVDVEVTQFRDVSNTHFRDVSNTHFS